jgi:hypothetical protein
VIVELPEAVLRRALESFRREGGYGYPTSQFQRARMKDAQTIAAAIRKAKPATQQPAKEKKQ